MMGKWNKGLERLLNDYKSGRLKEMNDELNNLMIPFDVNEQERLKSDWKKIREYESIVNQYINEENYILNRELDEVIFSASKEVHSIDSKIRVKKNFIQSEFADIALESQKVISQYSQPKEIHDEWKRLDEISGLAKVLEQNRSYSLIEETKSFCEYRLEELVKGKEGKNIVKKEEKIKENFRKKSFKSIAKIGSAVAVAFLIGYSVIERGNDNRLKSHLISEIETYDQRNSVSSNSFGKEVFPQSVIKKYTICINKNTHESYLVNRWQDVLYGSNVSFKEGVDNERYQILSHFRDKETNEINNYWIEFRKRKDDKRESHFFLSKENELSGGITFKEKDFDCYKEFIGKGRRTQVIVIEE